MSLQSFIERYCFLWDNQTLQGELDSRTGNDSASCHLNVALYPEEVFTSPLDSHRYVCSVSNAIMFIILKYLHCSINFVISRENFGGRLVNGSWNGILALLERKQADFIPHPFYAFFNRTQLLHYDFFISNKELLTLFSFPKHFNRSNLSEVFAVYSATIWVAIWISCTIVSLLATLQFKRPQRTLLPAFLDTFGVLVGQGHLFVTTLWLLHLNPLILASLAFFILRQVFSTDMTAVLLSRSAIKIDYFNQIGLYDLSLLAVNGSTTLQYFYQYYPQYTNRIVLVEYYETSSEKVLDRLLSQPYVLLTDGSTGEQLKQFYGGANSQLHGSTERFISTYTNFAIRKTLEKRLKDKLNQLTKRLYYFGIYDKLQQSLLPGLNVRLALAHLKNYTKGTALDGSFFRLTRPHLRLDSVDRVDANASSIDSSLVHNYFYLYAIGLGIAVGVFLRECARGLVGWIVSGGFQILVNLRLWLSRSNIEDKHFSV